MIQPCDRFDAEWDLLAVGALDTERSAELRAHAAAGCTRCHERLREARRLMGAIGAALEPMAPPPHVEARLLQRLAALDAAPADRVDALPPRAGGVEWAFRLAAAAAVIACAVLIWRDVDQRRELADLRARVERQAATPPIAPARPPVATPMPVPTPQPAAPPPPSPPPASPTGANAADDWALERTRMEAAIVEANTARARAEAEAARWREERDRLERTLASTVAAPGTAPPPIPAPQPGVDALRAEIGRLAAEVQRLEAQERREATRARSYLSALQAALDGGSRRTALRPIDAAAGGASASAVLTADGRLVLTTRGLPPLGSDKCYQLWIIRRDNPAVVSGGVLNDASSGQVVHVARVEGRPDAVTGFAITDEPAGGSVSSRGRKLLFGALQ